MSDTIIKIENLYKEYRLGVIGSGTLYWDLQSWWARIRGKEDPNKNINLLGLGSKEIPAYAGMTNNAEKTNNAGKTNNAEKTNNAGKSNNAGMTNNAGMKNNHGKNIKDDNQHFYALNDINLEVKEGEILGIIGRNGAGKTTLLKIISRITAPTKGTVKIKGRVGSLLEVGTGFHPELTGKENIYLNGAILGMRKKEIDKKLDEIIAFAEIEKFIDTPVKRYSSGMYVRLAFAVAAHLEPEILIVDEVLAVGDADFQKKCLGKMQDISKNQGRTVLFVSHNMTAIKSLCKKGVYLNNGKIETLDEIDKVINQYLNKETINKKSQIWDSIETAPGNEYIKINRILVESNTTDDIHEFTVKTPIKITVDFWNLKPETFINVSLVLNNLRNECIFNVSSESMKLSYGLFRTILYINEDFLNDDIFYVDYYFVKDASNVVFVYKESIIFEVHDIPREGTSWYGKWIGAVRPKLLWDYYKIC